MKYISSLLVCLTISAVECCRQSGGNAINHPLGVVAKRTKQLVPRGGGGGELKTTTPISTKKAVSLGCLLALNSGIVNGACLSGLLHPTKQASAAVTGAWTNSALGMASGNMQLFSINAKCIISYFSGSFIAGVIDPKPIAFEFVHPRAGISSITALCWIGSMLMAWSYYVAETKNDFSFIFSSAVAMGIQNSVTSTMTTNLVRSAHFSGITSDMGTFLGQVLRGNKQNLIKLQVFPLLALSFWMGGYLSFSLTSKIGTRVLLFSACLHFLMGIGIERACSDIVALLYGIYMACVIVCFIL